MASKITDNVKEYYGKILKTNEDFKTNVCEQIASEVPKEVKEALSLCHEEVISRYFGCGLVFPTAVKNVSVLDFGSGAGRDCFVLSKLVGKDGFVTGVDMTEEQVNIARKHIPYHMQKFGYTKPNVEFKLGYIEDLKEVGIKDESCDLIISNCVINLCPDKPSVFKEAFRVLKDGGELYFSDMYVDREIPPDIKNHKQLWGDGFGGALYWKSFVALMTEIGFLGPYVVKSRNLVCENEDLAKLLGDLKYIAVTCRLFKTSKKPDEKCCCSVKYNGTMDECCAKFNFDTKYTFDSNFQAVSCDIATVLKNSRYAQHLEFKDAHSSDSEYVAPRTSSDSVDPFELANKDKKKA